MPLVSEEKQWVLGFFCGAGCLGFFLIKAFSSYDCGRKSNLSDIRKKKKKAWWCLPRFTVQNQCCCLELFAVQPGER